MNESVNWIETERLAPMNQFFKWEKMTPDFESVLNFLMHQGSILMILEISKLVDSSLIFLSSTKEKVNIGMRRFSSRRFKNLKIKLIISNSANCNRDDVDPS